LQLVTAWYRGLPYRLDLARCRRALIHRQVAGELDSMESLAQAVGISRSTVSRFFSGLLELLLQLAAGLADFASS
jgi:hypothetical protein